MSPLKPAIAALLLACASQATALGSLADLSVYDRTEGRRLTVHWHEGRAYVAGKPGNEYQVAVRNNQGEDLLAVVSVDGVNVISGQTAQAGQGGYVLAPGGSASIQGWRKSLSETAAFYFTSLADSYAARTGRADNVGVIGVALFRRKQEPGVLSQSPPAAPRAEAERRANSGAAADAAKPAEQIGTGHGRHEASYARYAPFQRASQTPAE